VANKIKQEPKKEFL